MFLKTAKKLITLKKIKKKRERKKTKVNLEEALCLANNGGLCEFHRISNTMEESKPSLYDAIVWHPFRNVLLITLKSCKQTQKQFIYDSILEYAGITQSKEQGESLPGLT